jgi:hypothetical protein
MQILTWHCDNDVEIELEFMPDAAFDAEMVGFAAVVPGPEFGECETQGEDQNCNGPLAAARSS